MITEVYLSSFSFFIFLSKYKKYKDKCLEDLTQGLIRDLTKVSTQEWIKGLIMGSWVVTHLHRIVDYAMDQADTLHKIVKAAKELEE